jgi:uncharacterized protein (TIGR02001 family)
MTIPARIAGAIVAGAVSCAGTAAADEKKPKLLPGGFSATLTLGTDYIFRGISQTNRRPTVQGSFDWEIDTPLKDVKFFAGVWASNIQIAAGDNAPIEMDWYGGLKGTVGKFAWKFQFIYYWYPGARPALNYDYVEINPSIGYDFDILSVAAGFNWSPDFFGRTGNAFFFYGEVTVPIPIKELDAVKPAFVASIGYQTIERNVRAGIPDYLTWSIGGQITVEGFTLAVKYVDTDVKKDQCYGANKLCSARVLFTVSRTF